jgi:hypothetical protein
MTCLKDELKEKINWDQVDRVMIMVGCLLFLFLIKKGKNFLVQKTRPQSDGQ